jgi:AcrR family transcriptional regulator
MAAPATKQKILDASLELFNENGISNVRLQQIADETGISVGNLAYHFNNKEAITESLIDNAITALQSLLRQYGKYPSLADLDFFFKEYYQLGNQYKFLIFDILEIKRNFPALFEVIQPITNKIKLQVERRLELFVQQRLLQKELNSRIIASNIVLLMLFMPEEAQLSGKNGVSENQYRRRLWNFIIPYFTAKGSSEYNTSIESEFTGR